MKKEWRVFIQVMFLVLFVFLVVIGKAQVWMGLFILGLAAAFVLGRVYCGWICSINTAIKGITLLKKRLHIKSRKIPQVLTRPWVRYLALGLFMAVFIFIMVSGKKLPVLPVLLALGMVVTLIFPEELWHRYLCPYGTLLSWPASHARHTMHINEESCNSCGACIRVCPAKAVKKNEKRHLIKKASCLVCLDCSTTCRQQAISFK